MSSVSLTLNERMYIRRRVKKRINENIKRKIAQKIVESSYRNHSVDNFLASLPKDDLRGIISIYESHKDLIKIGVNLIEEKITTGAFTKSRANVDKILREHKVINKKGLIRESWTEFGLDMLFGVAPAIAALPPVVVATGGTSATVAVGLGVAGMIYYGYKFGKDQSEKNTLGMVINGMSFIFSAAEVFPMVGSAVAFVGKQIMRVLRGIFGFVFKFIKLPIKGIVAIGGKALAAVESQAMKKIFAAAAEEGGESAAKQLIPFLEKVGFGTAEELAAKNADELITMGKEVIASGGTRKMLSDEAQRLAAEAGEEALKNAKYFESLQGILKKGAELMQKATTFLAELAAKAKDLPVIGRFAGAIEKGMLAIEKNAAFILTRSERVGEAVVKAQSAGLADDATGILLTAAADVENAAAREALQTAAATDSALAKAAEEMGLLKEMGIELTTISDDLGAAYARGGRDAALDLGVEAAERMINQLKNMSSEVAQKLATDLESILARNMDSAGSGLTNTFFKEFQAEIAEATLAMSDEVAGLTGNALTDLLGAAGREVGGMLVTGSRMGAEGLEIAVKQGSRETFVSAKTFIKNGGSEAAKLVDDIGLEVAEQLSQKGAEASSELLLQTIGKEGTEEMYRTMTTQASEYLSKGGSNTIAMLAALSGRHPKALETFLVRVAGAAPKIASGSASSEEADFAGEMIRQNTITSRSGANKTYSRSGSLYESRKRNVIDKQLKEALKRKSLSILY